MRLAEYYFADPRLILVPIEHLTPAGMRPEFAALLAERCGWDAARIEFFNTAFALYWERSAALAARTRSWAPPRLRHVGLVVQPLAVRPYVQLLNTSAWTLYASDFDVDGSHPEFAAYLLVHGDRMAITREVGTAAVHNAAYWFERTDAECAAFAAAATGSPRPDAPSFRALAAALPWLRQLYHEDLRRAPAGVAVRSITGSRLLVPRAIEDCSPALVQQCTAAAHNAASAFFSAWRTPDRAAVTSLLDWLAGSTPRLVMTGQHGRILWDPDTPKGLGTLRHELRDAAGAAVRDVIADLTIIDEHTRAFRAALRAPDALPPTAPETEQAGYCYMHRERHLLAYNLHEPEIERLRAPALPYARAMLGARAVHEWAHRAVDAGWVPQTIPQDRAQGLIAMLAAQFDSILSAAPRAVRDRTAPDLTQLRGGATSAGTALAGILLTRMPDYQSNLLARRFLSTAERETYVRHNVRTLRFDYPPPQLWRMLARYLVEYQYLAFSDVADARTYFLRSTWFDVEFLATGILDAERFDALAAAVAALCATYAVDELQFFAVP